MVSGVSRFWNKINPARMGWVGTNEVAMLSSKVSVARIKFNSGTVCVGNASVIKVSLERRSVK